VETGFQKRPRAGGETRSGSGLEIQPEASQIAAVAAILADAFCGAPGYLWPMNARTFRNLGLLASSSFSRAAGSWAALVALVAISLGGCSFDLGSWGVDKEKPQQVADKPTDNISARSVSDSQGYATRGQVLAKSGKTEEALAEFDRALALDPYNVAALYGRGLAYQGAKQHEQAILDFTAANGLTPQKVEPLLGRAASYLALDKTKEAAVDLDEAVQADPNSALAWSARGQAYERLGDKPKAAESYGRALNLRPKDETARSGLARVGGKAG
jgi:tetratricopeptide (TPR) repeat protein